MSDWHKTIQTIGTRTFIVGGIVAIIFYLAVWRDPEPIAKDGPIDLRVVADLAPDQDEERIHVEVHHKNSRIFDASKQTEGDLVLTRAKPHGELALSLKGSSNYICRISSTTRLTRDGRALTGTGTNKDCAVAVKGNTTAYYGIEVGSVQVSPATGGSAAFTYRPFLQKAKVEGDPFANLPMPLEVTITAALGGVMESEDITVQFTRVAGGQASLHLSRTQQTGQVKMTLPKAGDYSYKLTGFGIVLLPSARGTPERKRYELRAQGAIKVDKNVTLNYVRVADPRLTEYSARLEEGHPPR